MTTTLRERLDSGIKYLVDERRVITGIAGAYGNLKNDDRFYYGNIREVRLDNNMFVPDVVPMDGQSVFDLASVTKLFTCISVLQLVERGKLSLDTTIGQIDKRFIHIPDATIGGLLSFRSALQTSARIDAASTAQEAERLLFEIRPAPAPKRRFYTDMGAMVLKYIVESAADQSYFEFLNENILTPLGMNHTFAVVPGYLLVNTAYYNYERTVVDGEFCVDTTCPAGTVHDPKARLLSTGLPAPCGHAGLFSTLADMVSLARGLLGGALLSRKTLLSIGVNRTGEKLPDGGYSQHMGYLCYAKHPVQTFSEVPSCFGERTIALNGFTGNHFSVDPEQNHFMILLANRIHNRVTTLTGRADPTDRTETVRWNDGYEYILSQNFVYMKDKYLKNTIGELLESYR
jgi:CubicO group peptidase (beta-lactamase class C family)